MSSSKSVSWDGKLGQGDQEAGHRASWLKSLPWPAGPHARGLWQREAEKRLRGPGALGSVWAVGHSVFLPHSGASDSFRWQTTLLLSPERLRVGFCGTKSRPSGEHYCRRTGECMFSQTLLERVTSKINVPLGPEEKGWARPSSGPRRRTGKSGELQRGPEPL